MVWCTHVQTGECGQEPEVGGQGPDHAGAGTHDAGHALPGVTLHHGPVARSTAEGPLTNLVVVDGRGACAIYGDLCYPFNKQPHKP